MIKRVKRLGGRGARVRHLRLLVEVVVPIEDYPLGIVDAATRAGVEEALRVDMPGMKIRVLDGEVIK